MQNYGFQPIDSDHTMFKYIGKHCTLIVRLYVDDRLVASDSDEEYRIFMKELEKRFELSADDEEVS